MQPIETLDQAIEHLQKIACGNAQWQDFNERDRHAIRLVLDRLEQVSNMVLRERKYRRQVAV